jgi:hypothetical protein
MDKSFHQPEADRQKQSGFLASLQIFNSLLERLTGFIQVTEEEQRDAGIYLGEQPQEIYD